MVETGYIYLIRSPTEDGWNYHFLVLETNDEMSWGMYCDADLFLAGELDVILPTDLTGLPYGLTAFSNIALWVDNDLFIEKLNGNRLSDEAITEISNTRLFLKPKKLRVGYKHMGKNDPRASQQHYISMSFGKSFQKRAS